MKLQYKSYNNKIDRLSKSQLAIKYQYAWEDIFWSKGKHAFKIGALVKISARRIKFALPTACPYANEWRLAALYLARAAPV